MKTGPGPNGAYHGSCLGPWVNWLSFWLITSPTHAMLALQYVTIQHYIYTSNPRLQYTTVYQKSCAVQTQACLNLLQDWVCLIAVQLWCLLEIPWKCQHFATTLKLFQHHTACFSKYQSNFKKELASQQTVFFSIYENSNGMKIENWTDIRKWNINGSKWLLNILL